MSAQDYDFREETVRNHGRALAWLGGTAIAAILGVIVMSIWGCDGVAANSLVAVATAAVAGMAAIFK